MWAWVGASSFFNLLHCYVSMFATMKAFQANTKTENSTFYVLEIQILLVCLTSFTKRMEFYISWSEIL